MLLGAINMLGKQTIMLCNSFGRFTLFFLQSIKTFFTTRLKVGKLFAQIEHIGVNSLSISILTGTFAGAVFAFQSYIAVKRFGGEEFIGPAVSLALARELSPVLTGLMVTGRAGSAIAAEIGTMRITEQIDALRTLCIDTYQYLIVPRILASAIILPLLSLFTTICGVIGGYLISVNTLGLNGEEYIQGIKRYTELQDVTNGLIKAAFFGLILAWVGCYKGFYTTRGARGVGIATTQAVVIGSIMILIANYFLTALLFD